MSCDNNRHQYLRTVSPEHSKVAKTFGSPAIAQNILERIFNAARARATVASKDDSPMMLYTPPEAEAKTRALFSLMQSRKIKPPTHAKDGLPKADAQQGYAALYDTLTAIEKGQPLPAMAKVLLEKTRTVAPTSTRQVSAVGIGADGILRCGNCGRFASSERVHICPMTTDAGQLRKKMARYGLPETSFSDDDLNTLLATAQAGVITMRHPATGEEVEVSLDGLPLALAGGFSPDSIATAPAITPDNRIIQVSNPNDGLLRPAPAPANAFQEAGMQHGVFLGAESPMTVTALRQATVQTAAPVQVGNQVVVTGGTPYDTGHFQGTEYRKTGSHGGQIATSDGGAFTVGDRFPDQTDWGTARQAGLAKAPKGGVAVGRTLIPAVDLLKDGHVVRSPGGLVELYDKDGGNLLAVYDPTTRVVGDTDGTLNASPAQMAAVLAEKMLNPTHPNDTAFIQDMGGLLSQKGNWVAAADGAYLTMLEELALGGDIQMGGTIATKKCGQCGQFMGTQHNCPAGGTEAPPEEMLTARRQEAQSAVAESLFGGSVHVTANIDVDTDPIAAALREQPQPTIEVQVEGVNASIDSKEFAAAIAAALKDQPGGRNTPAAPQDFSELAASLQAVAEALKAQVDRPIHVEAGGMDENAATAMQSLAEALRAGGGLPAAAEAATSARAAEPQLSDEERRARQKRTAGRPLAEGWKPETAQEHIFSPILLEPPDPFLRNVPREIGGDSLRPIAENIPPVNPNYAISTETIGILRAMSALLQIGAQKAKNGENPAWSRSFALYGTAGAGKNELARQLAASIRTQDPESGEIRQGIGYIQADILEDSSMEEMIGTTVLETDPATGSTVSRARLGKIGLAAATGSVISINEIVRNPKLATALQSMIEDGEIQINSPEAGIIRVPVHPSSIFVTTWNPGYEKDADRPGQAALSRMTSFKMSTPPPAESKERLEAFFDDLLGANGNKVAGDYSEIFQTDYSIGELERPTDQEMGAIVTFFNDLAAKTERRQGGMALIGGYSPTPTTPGPREMRRFALMGKALGWEAALEPLKIVCDQGEEFDSQWDLVLETFRANFEKVNNPPKPKK